MIRVKDSSVLFSLLRVPYDEMLMSVLIWIDDQYPGMIVITCGYRPGDPKCHGTVPCRAVDLRSWVFKDPELACNYINHVWEYDFKRPHMKVADVHPNRGASGTHIHIQVHPNTRLRKEEKNGQNNHKPK